MSKIDFSFKAFEAILTYAVDEINDTNEFNILKDINFNEDNFFEKLYVKRKKETDLQTELLKDTSQILVKGYPGTGKTTLLRKVLRGFEVELNAFILFVDFKKFAEINESRNSNYEELSRSIEKELNTRILNYLNLNKINPNDVTDFLVTQQKYINSEDFNNPNFINTLTQLQNIHNFDNEGFPDFLDWFQDQRKNKKSDQFKSHYLALSNSLKAHNYLYYLAFVDKENSGQRMCIICFDNVDSIIDSKVRDTFCQYFRQYQQITKTSAKSIISMRSDNPSLKLLSDAGAYIISRIDVTCDDFIDPELFEREKQEHKNRYGTDPDPESVEEIKLQLIRRATEKFTKSIYENRVRYVKTGVNEDIKRRMESNNPAETIDIEKIREFEEIFSLILDDSRIRDAFLDLCNNDRRAMSINKTNFAKYLINDVGLDSLDIELFRIEKDSIQFIMESYFYGWMNKNSHKFHEDEIYNLPRDLNTWSSSQSEIGCSLDHLILASIYNLSNQPVGAFSYDKFTTVGKILTNLQQIGYDRDTVLKKLYSIYRDKEGNYKGLIEVSRFHEIDSEDKFSDKDEIGLTPRSFYFTKYYSLKFIRIISSIRSYSIKDKERKEEFYYQDRYPITPITIERCLKFLCGLARMHLNGLCNAKIHLEKIYGGNWLSHYKRVFGIRPNVKSSNNLLFENLIKSVIVFLNHQKDVERERKIVSITKEMIVEFEKLQNQFADNLKKLNDGDFKSIEELRNISFCDQLNFSVFTKKNS